VTASDKQHGNYCNTQFDKIRHSAFSLDPASRKSDYEITVAKIKLIFIGAGDTFHKGLFHSSDVAVERVVSGCFVVSAGLADGIGLGLSGRDADIAHIIDVDPFRGGIDSGKPDFIYGTLAGTGRIRLAAAEEYNRDDCTEDKGSTTSALHDNTPSSVFGGKSDLGFKVP